MRSSTPLELFALIRINLDVRIEPLKVWHDVTYLEFIIYLMIFQFHLYLSLFHALYSISILAKHLLHCTWLRCLKSYTKDLSHGFLPSRWFVHNHSVDLGNPFKVIVHYILIGRMVGLSHQDGFPMMSALMCMVTHWPWLTMSHDIRLSSTYDFIKLLYCVFSQPWENTEFMQKPVETLTYEWDHKLILYFLWIESLLMEIGSNRYSQQRIMMFHRIEIECPLEWS